MENRKRYTQSEYERSTYYQLPQFLFDEEFASLSNDAKVLYTLLRARHDWSVTNGKISEKGEIYLIMTRESMGELLHMTRKTTIKTVNELKKFNLLEEERIGQGKPNRIFLLEILTCKKYTSRRVKIAGQEVEKLHPIYNSNNKTNSIYISESGKKETKTKKTPPEGSFDTDEFYALAVKKTYDAIKEPAEKHQTVKDDKQDGKGK